MSIYQEVILDHYHHPHNKGEIDNADASSAVVNSTCGDKISITLKIDDGVIEDVKFDGKGCAISIASASVLTDRIKGMTVKDAQKLNTQDIIELLGIELSPTRLKCALLPLEGISQALLQVK